MCSVSWLIDEDSYQIYFNRDEQKTRTEALPPKEININGINVLMPIDPVGGGSWISTNELGMSLCLLNNYQASNPNPVILSRGLLLRELAKEASIDDVCNAFLQLELPQFAPFSLLAFDRSICEPGKHVMALEWNGHESTIHPTDSPLFSSGVDLHNVVNYREAAYQDLVGGTPNQASLLAFHRHHHNEHSHMSVCMHREDAQTVSFTQIVVSAMHQEMRYVAGSPCQHLTKEALQNSLIALPRQPVLSVVT